MTEDDAKLAVDTAMALADMEGIGSGIAALDGKIAEGWHPALAAARLRLVADGDDVPQAALALLEALRQAPDNKILLRTGLTLRGGRVQTSDHVAQLRRAAKDPMVGATGGLLLAYAHLSRGEASAAWTEAKAALGRFASSGLRRRAGNALAAAFHWHGHWRHAENLVMQGRGAEEMLPALHDLLALRSVAEFGDATLALLRFVAAADGPQRLEATRRLLDYRWRVEGASRDLLEESAAWEAPIEKGSGAFRADRIALAAALGCWDEAAAMLASRPAAAASFAEVLPVGWLLHEDRALRRAVAPDAGPADFALPARLFVGLDQGSRRLAALLADPGRRIAVVGNAASAKDGEGPGIDAHQIVVRFNRARSGGEFAAMRGTRTDIHLLPLTQPVRRFPASPDASFICYAGIDASFRNRKWNAMAVHVRAGRVVAQLPGETVPSLIARLGAPPSNGLRFCVALEGLRGTLDRRSVFGFGFTDQIGRRGRSSHYFEAARPSMHHNWVKERAIFEGLFATAPRGDVHLAEEAAGQED